MIEYFIKWMKLVEKWGIRSLLFNWILHKAIGKVLVNILTLQHVNHCKSDIKVCRKKLASDFLFCSPLFKKWHFFLQNLFYIILWFTNFRKKKKLVWKQSLSVKCTKWEQIWSVRFLGKLWCRESLETCGGIFLE